jgi:hypothetical protein
MPWGENTVWDQIAIVGCAIGIFAAGLFLIEFHRRSRGAWRDTPFGKHLMLQKFLLLALFSLAIANRVFPDWPGREQATTLVLLMFVLQMFLPYRFLREAQKEHDREHRELPRPSTEGQAGVQGEGSGHR